MEPKFLTSAEEFRDWLEDNHASARELVIGFNKKISGRGGLTYPEALDEALCFGWIDGVRKSSGPDRYTIRFTPRRPGSNWSLVNIRHVERLTKAGRMHAAGAKAFAARTPAKTGVYSFERRPEKSRPDPHRQAARLSRNVARRARHLPWGGCVPSRNFCQEFASKGQPVTSRTAANLL